MDDKYRDLFNLIEELKEQVESLGKDPETTGKKEGNPAGENESETDERKRATGDKDYNWVGKKILIVEDNDVNYLVLQNMLKPTNAQLIWAKGGKMAIEICKSAKDIDIVLMDIMIPNFDGITATKKIKELLPDLPVIIQTAYPSRENKSRCKEVGCSGLIEKPVSGDKLLNIIEEQINK